MIHSIRRKPLLIPDNPLGTGLSNLGKSMEMCCLRLAFLLLAGMFLFPAIAEDTPRYWTKLMLEGKHFVKKQGISYRQAVAVAEKFGEEDPRLHLALHAAAGEAAFPMHDYKTAEPLFKRDIALLEKIDLDFPDLVSDLYELAKIYEDERRYKEAEPLLLRALAIRKKWDDVQSDDPFNATILGELCLLYNDLGQTAKSKAAYDRMVEDCKQLRTKQTRAGCFQVQSSLFHDYVDSHKELPYLQKMHFLQVALDFSKAAIANFKQDVDSGNELRNAGNICWQMNDLKQSEHYYRESIDLAFDNIEYLPDVAGWNLKAYDKFLFAQRRDHEVEQLQTRYLETVTNTFGKTGREYGDAVKICADVWWDHKEVDRSLKLKKQSDIILARLSKGK
jgi:tetratricopeptide (TPR) repeat protein